MFKTDQKNICRYPSIRNLKQLLKINDWMTLLIKSDSLLYQDIYRIITTNQNKIAYIIIASRNDEQFIKKSDESIPLFLNTSEMLLFGFRSTGILYWNALDKNSKLRFANFRILNIILTWFGKNGVIIGKYDISCIVLSNAQSISIDPPPIIISNNVTTIPR